MRLMMDSLDGSRPKRGDIVQTNVGDRRERTCMILRVKKVNRIIHINDPDPERATRDLIPRYSVWCERWWELEADFRMRLYRSAERAGGQCVIYFRRYKAKKKKGNPFYENPENGLPKRTRPRRTRQHLSDYAGDL